MLTQERHDTVFSLYEEAHKGYEKVFGKGASVYPNPEAFFKQLLTLHQEFMAGESSFSYMSEQLGVSTFALHEILSQLGLPAINV